jgi:hypothetical protein
MDLVQDSRNDLRANKRTISRGQSMALEIVDRVNVYNLDTNVQVIPRKNPGQVIPRKGPIVMSPRKDPGQVPFVVNYHY